MVVAFGNITSNNTTPWTPEPNGRGTWTVLSSCVITIALCAWTALHLNVPEHKIADRQWLRKAKWFMLGLAAPEIVVYIAWRQRQEAKRILRDVRIHLGQTKPKSRTLRFLSCCLRHGRTSAAGSPKPGSTVSSPTANVITRPEWSMVHGFYVVIGGFALDSSDTDEPFLPDSRSRAALTIPGLQFLLEHEPDLLPDISKDQIEDKSKADGLKKFLVCVQAGWFCASCITRLANSLPISLLELNAMGHAACALVIYAMWWEKPLDVDEPTLIRGYQIKPLLAYMWMSSGISAKGLKAYDMNFGLRDEFDALWMYHHDPRINDLLFDEEKAVQSAIFYDESTVPETPTQGQMEVSPLPEPYLNGFDPIKYPRSSRNYCVTSPSSIRYRISSWLHSRSWRHALGIRFPAGLGVRKTAIEHISPSTITRWRLAHDAVEKYHLEDDVRQRHRVRTDLYDQDPRVKARIGNSLPIMGNRPLEIWFGFAVAGFLYGGLHMLAWNAPFSSRVEQIFWRVAASSVTMTPLLLAPLAGLFEQKVWGEGATGFVSTLQGQNGMTQASGIRFWAQVALAILLILLYALAPLLGLSYVLGRVYLVVECFKNVAYLPEGVFQNVSWSAYLPHIN